MSEVCLKFQVHASNTVGGLAETRTVLQSVTDGQTDIHTDKGKTICPSHFRSGGIEKTTMVSTTLWRPMELID